MAFKKYSAEKPVNVRVADEERKVRPDGEGEGAEHRRAEEAEAARRESGERRFEEADRA